MDSSSGQIAEDEYDCQEHYDEDDPGRDALEPFSLSSLLSPVAIARRYVYCIGSMETCVGELGVRIPTVLQLLVSLYGSVIVCLDSSRAAHTSRPNDEDTVPDTRYGFCRDSNDIEDGFLVVPSFSNELRLLSQR